MLTKRDISSAPDAASDSAARDTRLASDAADGDRQARARVNELAAPIIDYQTARFCKRFCNENRYRYRCTLSKPVGPAPSDSSLCEWGNGSYGWMLDDLTSARRLRSYQGRNDASLFDYLYVIANSSPFYERWKDWRFDRRVHVPEYIRDLGKPAVTVFYGLRSQQSYEQIGQQNGFDADLVRSLGREITRQLAQRNRLHLLDPVKRLSLSQTEDDDLANNDLEAEIARNDEPAEDIEQKQRLKECLARMTPVERFVMEALVIEEQEANDVLENLKAMGISIKQGIDADQTNRQQLYYFRRKTIEKLSALMAEDT